MFYRLKSIFDCKTTAKRYAFAIPHRATVPYPECISAVHCTHNNVDAVFHLVSKDLDVGAAAFRLQSAAALKQQRRLATQLRHQQQSGEERMTRVDFEQLRITNARVLETISQKNVQMIELKNIGTSVGYVFQR